MKNKQALEYIKHNPLTNELTYKYRKIKEHPVTGNIKPNDAHFILIESLCARDRS